SLPMLNHVFVAFEQHCGLALFLPRAGPTSSALENDSPAHRIGAKILCGVVVAAGQHSRPCLRIGRCRIGTSARRHPFVAHQPAQRRLYMNTLKKVAIAALLSSTAFGGAYAADAI